ncbi:heptosyltransferase-1 [Granulicella rosea]|uniref:Heptosyltransferase-1 n=2 Tax=Granulicella rosea TaxID=474952 RepID=A0A239JMR6_9BACT|nr:heptosyltransferase-1 [Granulicella rosea]
MGDVVHALPAVAALRRALPDCHLGWAIEPRWSELLETRRSMPGAPRGPEKPLVDRVHPVPTRAWKQRPVSLATLREIVTLRREMLAERYDLCVDLQGSIRSSIVGWLAGAQRFFGPEAPREKQARWLYGTPFATSSAHVIEQACELLGAAAGLPLKPATVEFPREARAELWAKSFLEFELKSQPYVVLAPTAGWGAKEWPAERYRKLAAALGAAGLSVVVNAVPGKMGVPDSIALGGVAKIAVCNLPHMVSLLRHASLVIGGDSGPIHVAAALGRPVLSLFGPTDPARTGPLGERARTLRHPGSITDHRRHRATEEGLAKIGVDEVLGAALELLVR